ncbi:MAG: uroporphyrinogen-III C-methyltransferase [bacterium]
MEHKGLLNEQCKGKVYLVGAGPGDYKLITLRGLELIQMADVLVYDYLANKKFLDYAREDAERIYVGKKGSQHTLEQDDINQLIIKKAREGKIVIRLKGGDPFVFGRGAEEAQDLIAEGIEFEVVPGVTSAIAAPAYAGIPLTHRDYSPTATFITGHEGVDKKGPEINWAGISKGVGTLVFLMGVANLPNIVNNLLEHGRDAQTPVALVRWGTRPEQETITGKLEDIVAKVKEAGFKSPAVIIVGEVVKLRDTLNWFERKPLFGKKIVVTRAREQASILSELLYEYGADAIEFPTIKIIPTEDWSELDESIRSIERFNWLIFTSVNGVKYFFDRLFELKKDSRDLKGVKICTIGPATKEKVEAYGLRVDCLPSEYRAEAVIDLLGKLSLKDQKILILRAEVAREILPEKLTELGAEVTLVKVYKTIQADGDVGYIKELLDDNKIDVITFTSSSTVKNFVEMFKDEAGGVLELLKGVYIASIGPITDTTVKEFGLESTIIPKDYTIPALVRAIVEYSTHHI